MRAAPAKSSPSGLERLRSCRHAVHVHVLVLVDVHVHVYVHVYEDEHEHEPSAEASRRAFALTFHDLEGARSILGTTSAPTRPDPLCLLAPFALKFESAS